MAIDWYNNSAKVILAYLASCILKIKQLANELLAKRQVAILASCTVSKL